MAIEVAEGAGCAPRLIDASRQQARLALGPIHSTALIAHQEVAGHGLPGGANGWLGLEAEPEVETQHVGVEVDGGEGAVQPRTRREVRVNERFALMRRIGS